MTRLPKAFKCDVPACGRITEESFLVLDTSSMKFKLFDSYADYWGKTVCSGDCAKAALDAWLQELAERKEKEAKEQAEAEAQEQAEVKEEEPKA
jgi:hypothetical protein